MAPLSALAGPAPQARAVLVGCFGGLPTPPAGRARRRWEAGAQPRTNPAPRFAAEADPVLLALLAVWLAAEAAAAVDHARRLLALLDSVGALPPAEQG